MRAIGKGYIEEHCMNWEEAKKSLLYIASSCRDIYFRGQADSEWILESSFTRLAGEIAGQRKLQPRSSEWAELEKGLEEELLHEFEMAYHRISDAPPLPDRKKEENEFLALAQHYDLPTRLLDWSRSPYVAAFFAFSGCKKDPLLTSRKVAIWSLDWEKLDLLLYCSYNLINRLKYRGGDLTGIGEGLRVIRGVNSIHPRIDRIEALGNPNRRMVFQEGLFTRVIKVADDIEAYLRRQSQHGLGTILTKIIIPGEQQTEALKDLSLMTINPVSLMDDPGGAAATAFNSVVRLNPKYRSL